MANSKGDGVSYSGMHQRLRLMRGLASNFTCPCGRPATEWSYNHSGVAERTSKFVYSTDPEQYDALCRICHNHRDQVLVLSARLANEARHQWATGEWTAQQLATEFGLDRRALRRVLTGERWEHAGGPIVTSTRADATNSNLTPRDVWEIKSLYAERAWTGWSMSSLAEEFGVYPTTIYRMVTGQSWKHIDVDRPPPVGLYVWRELP